MRPLKAILVGLTFAAPTALASEPIVISNVHEQRSSLPEGAKLVTTSTGEIVIVAPEQNVPGEKALEPAADMQELSEQQMPKPHKEAASSPEKRPSKAGTRSPVKELDLGSPDDWVVLRSVNVRKGPGTEHGRLDVARQGEVMEVTGRSADGSGWLQVKLNGAVGYVHQDFIRPPTSVTASVLPVIVEENDRALVEAAQSTQVRAAEAKAEKPGQQVAVQDYVGVNIRAKQVSTGNSIAAFRQGTGIGSGGLNPRLSAAETKSAPALAVAGDDQNGCLIRRN